MAKIPYYPKVNKINDEDVFLIDGEDGTRTIEAETLAEEMGERIHVTNLEGEPTAPTPDSSDNSNRVATTSYVKTLISNLINGAPETLDTLKEIADALGENVNTINALNSLIQGKLDKTGGTMTGKLNAYGGISLSDTTTRSDLEYILGIDTYGTGGTVHFQDKAAFLNGKVDKVSGKSLSTNDYTTAEKNKLAGIADGANKYVHPTSSGYKHIPSGGNYKQALKNNGNSGMAEWVEDISTGFYPYADIYLDADWFGMTKSESTFILDNTELVGYLIVFRCGISSEEDERYNYTIYGVQYLHVGLKSKTSTILKPMTITLGQNTAPTGYLITQMIEGNPPSILFRAYSYKHYAHISIYKIKG